MQEQHGDQRELPAAAELEDPAVVDDLERAEDAELHFQRLQRRLYARLDADWPEFGRLVASLSHRRLRQQSPTEGAVMKKVLTITFGLLIAVVAAAGAQAGPAPTQPTAVERIIAQEDYRGVRASTQPTAMDRIVAQEDFKGVTRTSAQPTAVDRIITQEQGRHADPAIFGPSAVESELLAVTQPTAMERLIAQEQGRYADRRLFVPAVAPVQVVRRAGGFDWADAGIGGAAALSLALLAAAALALRHGRPRHEAHA